MATVELLPMEGGTWYEGTLADGRHVTIVPLVFHRARLTVGRSRMYWDQAW